MNQVICKKLIKNLGEAKTIVGNFDATEVASTKSIEARNRLVFLLDEIKFLLPVLNSSFVYFLFRKFYMGGGIEGELKTNNLEQLPVPQILAYEQQPFIELADKIIQYKEDGKDTILFENQIDQLVYQLYDLTDEEIAVVEKASS